VLRRAFDTQEGMTPKSYIVHRRVQEIMGLLASTELTVAEIADRLGFNSPFFMTRQFTQHVGLSPDAWRKQQASEVKEA
jgi:AraC-like DNA-binding protein